MKNVQYQAADVEDDLTTDEQTIVTLASRMSLMENNINPTAINVNQMISSFTNAMNQAGNVNNMQAPAPREGAGVSP